MNKRRRVPAWYMGDRFEPWFQRHFPNKWVSIAAKVIVLVSLVIIFQLIYNGIWELGRLVLP